MPKIRLGVLLFTTFAALSLLAQTDPNAQAAQPQNGVPAGSSSAISQTGLLPVFAVDVQLDPSWVDGTKVPSSSPNYAHAGANDTLQQVWDTLKSGGFSMIRFPVDIGDSQAGARLANLCIWAKANNASLIPVLKMKGTSLGYDKAAGTFVASVVSSLRGTDSQQLAAYSQIAFYQLEDSINHPGVHPGNNSPESQRQMVLAAAEALRKSEGSALNGTGVQASPIMVSSSFDYELIAQGAIAGVALDPAAEQKAKDSLKQYLAPLAGNPNLEAVNVEWFPRSISAGDVDHFAALLRELQSTLADKQLIITTGFSTAFNAADQQSQFLTLAVTNLADFRTSDGANSRFVGVIFRQALAGSSASANPPAGASDLSKWNWSDKAQQLSRMWKGGAKSPELAWWVKKVNDNMGLLNLSSATGSAPTIAALPAMQVFQGIAGTVAQATQAVPAPDVPAPVTDASSQASVPTPDANSASSYPQGQNAASPYAQVPGQNFVAPGQMAAANPVSPDSNYPVPGAQAVTPQAGTTPGQQYLFTLLQQVTTQLATGLTTKFSQGLQASPSPYPAASAFATPPVTSSADPYGTGSAVVTPVPASPGTAPPVANGFATAYAPPPVPDSPGTVPNSPPSVPADPSTVQPTTVNPAQSDPGNSMASGDASQPNPSNPSATGGSQPNASNPAVAGNGAQPNGSNPSATGGSQPNASNPAVAVNGSQPKIDTGIASGGGSPQIAFFGPSQNAPAATAGQIPSFSVQVANPNPAPLRAAQAQLFVDGTLIQTQRIGFLLPKQTRSAQFGGVSASAGDHELKVVVGAAGGAPASSSKTVTVASATTATPVSSSSGPDSGTAAQTSQVASPTTPSATTLNPRSARGVRSGIPRSIAAGGAPDSNANTTATASTNGAAGAVATPAVTTPAVAGTTNSAAPTTASIPNATMATNGLPPRPRTRGLAATTATTATAAQTPGATQTRTLPQRPGPGVIATAPIQTQAAVTTASVSTNNVPVRPGPGVIATAPTQTQAAVTTASVPTANVPVRPGPGFAGTASSQTQPSTTAAPTAAPNVLVRPGPGVIATAPTQRQAAVATPSVATSNVPVRPGPGFAPTATSQTQSSTTMQPMVASPNVLVRPGPGGTPAVVAGQATPQNSVPTRPGPTTVAMNSAAGARALPSAVAGGSSGTIDLAVGSAEIRVSPSIPTAGQSASFAATIRNLGTMNSTSGTVMFKLLVDGRQVAVSQPVRFDLASRGAYQAQWSSTIPAGRQAQVLVVVTTNNDTNLANNQAALAFAITPVQPVRR